MKKLRFEDLKLELEDYNDTLHKAIYVNIIPKHPFKHYADDYIFDEDKSVKWNKEQVKIENDKFKEECIRLQNLAKEHQTKVINEIADFIFDYLNRYYKSEISLSLNQIIFIIKHIIETTEEDDSLDYAICIIHNIVAYLNFIVDFNLMGGE